MSALAGPYIVEVRWKNPLIASVVEKRRAVAALDAAADWLVADNGVRLSAEVIAQMAPWLTRQVELRVRSGRLAFPDGFEIVVEATTYERLWDDLTDRPPFIAGVDCTIWVGGDGVEDARWGAAILAAWNAEYGEEVGR
jgi:hypothetical protein